MFKRLKNKKGFSIVEVVIAMVVVSIVTVAAISISSSASNNARKAMYNLDAQYFAADVIECYKSANNAEQIPLDAITFRDGATYGTETDAEGVIWSVYILKKSGYKAYVKVNSVKYVITVRVEDNAGNIIASAEYTRGG